jgi:ATP-dependent DNA ligase
LDIQFFQGIFQLLAPEPRKAANVDAVRAKLVLYILGQQLSYISLRIVLVDDTGRPNFNFLQHSRSKAKRICCFVFDLLIYDNRDLMQLSLVERREILKSKVKFQSPRVRIVEYFETSAEAMVQSALEHGLGGVVAKRKSSRYEAGKRTGAWAKFRLNSGQELVIGGYVPGAHGVDSVIVGDPGTRSSRIAKARKAAVP